MSKICSSCGRELPDYAMTCTYCGGVVNSAPNQYGNDGFNNNFSTGSSSKNKRNLIIVLGGCAALIAVVVLLFTFVFSSGAEDAVMTYYDVMFDEEYDDVVDLAPEDVIEYYEDVYDMDIDDVIDLMPDVYEEDMEELEDEYGKDVSIDYEVIDEEKIEGERFDMIKDNLKEEYDISKSSIEEVRALCVKFVIETKNGDVVSYNKAHAIKIDGEWYPCGSYGSFRIGTIFDSCEDLDNE